MTSTWNFTSTSRYWYGIQNNAKNTICSIKNEESVWLEGSDMVTVIYPSNGHLSDEKSDAKVFMLIDEDTHCWDVGKVNNYFPSHLLVIF